MVSAHLDSKPVFHDFILSLDNLVDYDVTKKGKIILFLEHNGQVQKIIVKNSPLNQLLQLLGFEKIKPAKELIRKNPEALRGRLVERLKTGPLVVSAVENQEAPGVWVAYRVTTEEYTPIPHRVLFEFAEGVLKQYGVEVKEKHVRKFFKRTAMAFLVAQYPLEYARQGDALNVYLVVSNANNARDSIHVYGYGEILLCQNGLVSMSRGISVHIVHKGNVASILDRVKAAIERVLGDLRQRFKIAAEQITELQRIEVPESLIWDWLMLLFEKNKIPKKYHSWFRKVVAQYLREFGANAETMFQTLTFFTTRLQNKNVDAALRLNKEAHRLLTDPRQYIVEVARAR